MNKKAFTLVELIVVITILAILGTIAFISLQGYARDARNSTRAADTNSMQKVLELYSLKESTYPIPDNFQIVSFSGELLRDQGFFGDEVGQKIGSLLSTIPVDPLTKAKYIYSRANNKKEQEILTVYEGAYLTHTKKILNQANAEDKYSPKITGNYNGVFIQTNSYIVPVPSIINSEVGDVELYLSSGNIGSQVVTGEDNIIGDGEYVVTQTGSINIPNFEVADILSGSLEDNQDDIIDAIETTFSGTDLEKIEEISVIIKLIENGDEDEIFEIIFPDEPGNVDDENDEESGNEVSGEPMEIMVCDDMTQEDVDILNNYYYKNSGYGDFTKEDRCELTYLSRIEKTYTRIPKQIGFLTELVSLDLHGAYITEIPKEIGNLTKLTSLNLEENILSGLPKEIGNLTNLTDLYLGQNSISEVPAEIGSLTNLRSLFIYDNLISEIPVEIGNLINLNALSLGGNKLTTLPTTLSSLDKVSYLTLGSNDFTVLPSVVGQMSGLENFSLRDSYLLTKLPDELVLLTNLSSFDATGSSYLGDLAQNIWRGASYQPIRGTANITVSGKTMYINPKGDTLVITVQ